MKLVFLIGNDKHHKYLVNTINKYKNIELLLIENKKIINRHIFKQQRDIYEKSIFKDSSKINENNFKSIIKTSNINDKKIIKKINSTYPDIIFCCGISILKYETIRSLNTKNILNFHGGNPLEYRGLDSHFWSIYHNDFKNIKVALHFLNSKIDDGEIVMMKKINLKNIKHLYELRYYNIKLCKSMVLELIKKYKLTKLIPRKIQSKKGRYYSSFPDELIYICENKFNKVIKK